MESLQKGMIIDGVFASEHIDTSGEILEVEGCDISDLVNGVGVLNFEHKGDSPMDILGKITYAKKIKSANDCSNEREKAYWNQVKIPFIYGHAELFDGENHPGALAVASLVRYYHNRKEPLLARFSIEGTTLERNGNSLKRSIARRVALTLKPCNRSCYSGVLFDDGPSLKQSEKEIYKGDFYEAHPIVLDPVEKLAGALERLRELTALHKAMDEKAMSTPMLLEHHSKIPNLDVIDPKFYGSGIKGEERERKNQPDWVDRAYYYTPGTQPEAFLGPHKYTAQLPADAKIYDIGTDPEGFTQNAIDRLGFKSDNVAEKRVKDAGYFGFRNSTHPSMSSVVALFHPLKPLKMETPVQKAMTAGGGVGGTAPSARVGGEALQAEEIVGTEDYRKKKAQVFAAFRDWDRVKPIREFLKFRLPDASDRYIDKFASLVDDYQVRKSEELFLNLEKALKLSSSIQFFETLVKAPKELLENPDNGIYRVFHKDSPRQIARFSLQDGNFEALEDHRSCFGPGCLKGALGEPHAAALEALANQGHKIVREDDSFASAPQAELYHIVMPDTQDIIVVQLVDNKLAMLDGTAIPERNVDALLSAVEDGEIQMVSLQHDQKPEITKTEDSGNPKRPTPLKGGRSEGMTADQFDPEQLAAGVKVEMEHTTDPKVAEHIARDHLAEDPDYYKKLALIHKD